MSPSECVRRRVCDRCPAPALPGLAELSTQSPAGTSGTGWGHWALGGCAGRAPLQTLPLCGMQYVLGSGRVCPHTPAGRYKQHLPNGASTFISEETHFGEEQISYVSNQNCNSEMLLIFFLKTYFVFCFGGHGCLVPQLYSQLKWYNSGGSVRDTVITFSESPVFGRGVA